MAKYPASTIAHWFIRRNEIAMDDFGAENMTILKLLKLLYYAEGCHLALNDGMSLFDEEIIAWEHGAAVKEVYDMYRDSYGLPLSFNDIEDAKTILPEDASLLEEVFLVFGQYSTLGLRNKNRQETPWLEATNGGTVLNNIINRNAIKQYFKDNYIE